MDTLTNRKPILVALLLFAITLLFRLADIFILRLDERLGETILSKSLGFALVVAYLWWTGRRLGDIGFHACGIKPALLVGSGITLLALVCGYALEVSILSLAGNQSGVMFEAIDPKTNLAGGAFFFAWLLVGNFINSFMEEGLFRGVMLQGIRISESFWRCNWFQAFLFGIWHLPWAAKAFQTGAVQSMGEITFTVLANFLPQLIMGLIWGYMVFKTGNLWSAWIAHTVTNSTLNFVHVSTAQGLDIDLPVRIITYLLMISFSLLGIRKVIKKSEPIAEPR